MTIAGDKLSMKGDVSEALLLSLPPMDQQSPLIYDDILSAGVVSVNPVRRLRERV